MKQLIAVLMVLSMVVSPVRTLAQAQEIQQLLLDVTKLAQFRRLFIDVDIEPAA